MNGPQHYRTAEELIKAAQYDGYDNARGALAAAQVHATLALAAAAAPVDAPDAQSETSWDEVLSS